MAPVESLKRPELPKSEHGSLGFTPRKLLKGVSKRLTKGLRLTKGVTKEVTILDRRRDLFSLLPSKDGSSS